MIARCRTNRLEGSRNQDHMHRLAETVWMGRVLGRCLLPLTPLDSSPFRASSGLPASSVLVCRCLLNGPSLASKGPRTLSTLQQGGGETGKACQSWSPSLQRVLTHTPKTQRLRMSILHARQIVQSPAPSALGRIVGVIAREHQLWRDGGQGRV